MAYTTVPTVAVGDLWTAAQHNLYIRDNFAAEPPSGFTGKAKMRVGSGVNTTGIFSALGDAYASLFAEAAQTFGMKMYTYAPGAILAGGSLTCPNDAETQVIVWGGGAPYDWGGFVTGTQYFTIPPGYGGTYLVTLSAQWTAHATTLKFRQIGIRCSVAGIFFVTGMQNVDGTYPWLNLNVILNLVAGETVKAYAQQISGGNLNLINGYFAIARIQ